MQTIKDSIKTVIVSLITLSLISVAYAAWTEPASNPPAGNTNPPITTASNTQTKTGWFTADNIEAYGKTVLATVTGNVGIGTTNPGATYKLDVAGAINATTGLYISGTQKDTVWDGKQDAIAAGTTSQYWRGDKTWQNLTTLQVTEGTNLYFTNARAQAAITGGASTITTANLTANKALVSNASGKVDVSVVTNTELGYVSKVTSSIQTQLNAKAPTASPTLTGSTTIAKLKVNDILNTLAPTDTNGNWTWTRVVSNTFAPGPGSRGSSWNWVNLDANKPVLGIQISGSSDDGGTCEAGVTSYFFGAATNISYVSDLDLDGILSGSQWSNGASAFATGTWIFENISAGRYLGAQNYGDNTAYNKSAGLTYIPPGKILYYRQFYNDGGGGYGNTCYVDVLYGNSF